MSDPELYEDGSSLTWGDDIQIYESTSSDIPEIFQSKFDSESDSEHCVGYGDIPDPNLVFLTAHPYYTGNTNAHTLNGGYPEADTTFSTDFNTPTHTPRLEDNSYQTGNADEFFFGNNYLEYHSDEDTTFSTSDQTNQLEGDSSSTWNADQYLLGNANSGYSSYQPEANTAFNTPDQTMQLEGDPYFTGNAGLNPPYNSDIVEASNFQDSDKTGYTTTFNQSDRNPLIRDDPFFGGGADDQFTHAAGAESLGHAAWDTMPPPSLEIMLESTVDSESDHDCQDPPQSDEDYNIDPFDPDQPNERPSLPQKSQRGRPWSQKDIDKLLRLYADGHSFDAIAQELGRTRRACQDRRLLVIKMEQQAKEKEKKEAETAAWVLPKDVPILQMKDARHVNGKTLGHENISHVDWANPRLKDKRELDWMTPRVEEWLHPRLETIRNCQKTGPWARAWDIAAAELNEANSTNLTGRDLSAYLPHPGYLQSLRRRQAHGGHTQV